MIVEQTSLPHSKLAMPRIGGANSLRRICVLLPFASIQRCFREWLDGAARSESAAAERCGGACRADRDDASTQAVARAGTASNAIAALPNVLAQAALHGHTAVTDAVHAQEAQRPRHETQSCAADQRRCSSPRVLSEREHRCWGRHEYWQAADVEEL